MSKQKLSLPAKDAPVPQTPEGGGASSRPAIDLRRMTRERVVLALLPIASRAELTNTQQIVEKAKALCEYIDSGLVAGQKPDPFL